MIYSVSHTEFQSEWHSNTQIRLMPNNKTKQTRLYQHIKTTSF